jgi:hypothetical protein
MRMGLYLSADGVQPLGISAVVTADHDHTVDFSRDFNRLLLTDRRCLTNRIKDPDLFRPLHTQSHNLFQKALD